MSDMVFLMAVGEDGLCRYEKMNAAAMKGSGLNDYAYRATFRDVVQADEAEILQAHYQRALRSNRPVPFTLDHNGQVGETILNVIFVQWQMYTHHRNCA